MVTFYDLERTIDINTLIWYVFGYILDDLIRPIDNMW